MAPYKTALLLLVAFTALVMGAQANAESLVEVGDVSLGLTVQSLQVTRTTLHAQVRIENLSRAHEVFVHYEPGRTDALDYFFVPVAKGSATNTVFLSVAPLGNRLADLSFRLSLGQRLGLLVLGENVPPYDQVAVALAPLVESAPVIAAATAPAIAAATTRPVRVAARPQPIPSRSKSPRPVKVAVRPVRVAARPQPTPHPHRPVRIARHVPVAAPIPHEPLKTAVNSRPPKQRANRARPVRKSVALTHRSTTLALRPQVVFLPPSSRDHVVSVFASPLSRLGRVLILWAGHKGTAGYGWERIRADHPDVLAPEIGYAATYPHQIWTDGKTYLFVRWNSTHGGALVLQVAGNSIVSARWATYDDLVYWLGPGRIYPRLVYQGS